MALASAVVALSRAFGRTVAGLVSRIATRIAGSTSSTTSVGSKFHFVRGDRKLVSVLYMTKTWR